MESENEALLIEGAKVFGIELDQGAADRFNRYLMELLKWNLKINLTAIRTEKGIVLKHFIDSLSVYPHLDGRRFLLDLGSGAGFPGIPLKIVHPSFEITLIESVLKKVDFQKHMIRILGLKGIQTIHGRVEVNKIPEELEGRFDAVLSRALSDLRTFLLMSDPFLRRGGAAVAMKGGDIEEELQRSVQAEDGRYRLLKQVSFSLPFTSFKRSILLFEKQ